MFGSEGSEELKDGFAVDGGDGGGGGFVYLAFDDIVYDR